MFKNKKKTIDLILLSIIYFSLLTYYYVTCLGTSIRFFDTDDLMRVVRIKEFFQHYDLSNYIIARCNYPEGCDLHWTRLYDFILIGASWLVNWFQGSLNQSIVYTCFCISPFIGFCCVLLIYNIFTTFMPKKDLFIASALFCVSSYLLSVFSFGRPDHHSFILMCMLLFIYYTIQMVLNPETKNYVKAAIATTICVWASPETLIVILITDAVLFLCYFHNFKLITNLYFKNIMTAIFVGLVSAFPLQSTVHFIGIPICIILLMIPYTSLSKRPLHNDSFFRNWHFVCLMMLLLFIPQIHPVEYDKISIIHVTLFMCVAMFFAVHMHNTHNNNKFLHSILWFIILSFIFLSIYPRFLMGMSADVAPLIKEIWLSKIRELQSPLCGNMKITFLANATVITTAIIIKTIEILHNLIPNHVKSSKSALVIMLRRHHKQQHISPEDTIWLIFIAIATCYLILSCFAYRMLPYSVTFGLPIVIYLGMSSKLFSCHRLIRIVITMFLYFILFFVTSAFVPDSDDTPSNATESQNKYILDKEFYNYLDNLSSQPITIMANSNNGPRIIYYTKHYAVGAPYHRQQIGILWSHIVTERPVNMRLIYKALLATNTKYIMVSHQSKKMWPESFTSKLITGKIPNWINTVPVPEQFKNNYSVFEVDKDLLLLDMQTTEETAYKVSDNSPDNTTDETDQTTCKGGIHA